MKRLFSVLLVLVMLSGLLSVPALGEEADDAYTVDVSLSLDSRVLTDNPGVRLFLSQRAIQALSVLAEVLNNTSLHAVLAGSEAHADLMLKDMVIAEGDAWDTNAGIAAVSDLFPSLVITGSVGGRSVKSVTKKLVSSLRTVNSSAMPGKISLAADKISGAFLTRVGEEEAVETVFEGVTFPTRRPVQMTTKELVLSAARKVRELMDRPDAAAVMAVIGKKMPLNPALLDQFIERIDNTPDEKLPALEAYLMESGDNRLMDMTLSQENETFTLQFGFAANRIAAHASMPDELKADAVLDLTRKHFDMGLTAFFGMPISVSLSAAVTGDSAADALLSFSLNGTPVASGSVSLTPSGEITHPVSAEGKTEIRLSALAADRYGNDMLLLLNDLKTHGLYGLMTRAAAAMPEEVSSLVSFLTRLNRSPATPTE